MALPEGPSRDQARAAVLEQLVNEALLRKAASREAIVADPQAVEAAVEQLRGQVAARGGDFAAALAQMGRDEAGLREQIGSELLLREFLGRRLTKQAIETFFEQRHREFDGTLVRVSHVVLRPDLGRGPAAVEECVARAAAIREQILLGATTIGEAARAHSAGPSRRRDGDVGFLPRHGAADVAEEIVRATLAQERQQAEITYENGVPHFDPATPADGSVPRRVVIDGAVGSP
jgi:peptidyl-prolyl cis-trans isomerase SurA